MKRMNYEEVAKSLKEDFKQYIIDVYGDMMLEDQASDAVRYTKALTPDLWLDDYLASIRDMIAGNGRLKKIVEEAKGAVAK